MTGIIKKGLFYRVNHTSQNRLLARAAAHDAFCLMVASEVCFRMLVKGRNIAIYFPFKGGKVGPRAEKSNFAPALHARNNTFYDAFKLSR